MDASRWHLSHPRYVKDHLPCTLLCTRLSLFTNFAWASSPCRCITILKKCAISCDCQPELTLDVHSRPLILSILTLEQNRRMEYAAALRQSHQWRPLPSLVDSIALDDPNRTIVSFPAIAAGGIEYLDVNFAAFARAINRSSWWLEENIGRSDSFKTLSYVGPSDLRLIILVFAAVKTGHKVSIS